jgi:RHS repeat-associated protein
LTFGKTLRSFNGGNKYGHQGSQRENELSENDYYTHFRGLDDDIARWKQIDPIFSPSESPYVSMSDNPVMFNDVLGNETEDWFKNLKTGKVEYNDAKGKKGDEVALKGSADTWKNIGADTKDKDVQAALSFQKFMSNPPATGALQSDYTFDGGAVIGTAVGNILKPIIKPIIAPVLKYFGIGSEAASEQGMTTVGRWMSGTEYATMRETGAMVEGAGGQTFVSVGGSGSFNAAAKGSVYAEFKLPANSLLQGGQSNWYKTIGPNAGNAMQNALKKQGGEILPKISGLTEILHVK